MSKSGAMLAILLSLTTVAPVAAVEREKTVRFKPGTTSAGYSDETRGPDLVSYFLDARAGQNLAIAFRANLESCVFVVRQPDGKDTVSDSYARAEKYTATLPDTGRYEVKVYQTRVTSYRDLICRYAINFEIKG